jgi:hypothetical protein
MVTTMTEIPVQRMTGSVRPGTTGSVIAKATITVRTATATTA